MPCYSSFVLKETDFIMKAPDCLCPQRICPEFKDYYPTSLCCGFLREFLIYGNCWCIMFILLTETEAVLQVLSHFYCHAAGQTEWDSNDRLQMKWSGKSLPQRQNLQMCSSELFFFFKNTHETERERKNNEDYQDANVWKYGARKGECEGRRKVLLKRLVSPSSSSSGIFKS